MKSTDKISLDEKLDLIFNELQQIKLDLQSANTCKDQNYTLKEAAAYLKLSISRTYELVYTGKLIPLQHKKYHRLLFSIQSLNQYLYDNK